MRNPYYPLVDLTPSGRRRRPVEGSPNSFTRSCAGMTVWMAGPLCNGPSIPPTPSCRYSRASPDTVIPAKASPLPVILAKAGIQGTPKTGAGIADGTFGRHLHGGFSRPQGWIPAGAGLTAGRRGHVLPLRIRPGGNGSRVELRYRESVLTTRNHAVVVMPVVGGEPVAVGGADVDGFVGPATAAKNPLATTACGCPRGTVQRRSAVTPGRAVLHPLPNVAVHVVKAEGIGGKPPTGTVFFR